MRVVSSKNNSTICRHEWAVLIFIVEFFGDRLFLIKDLECYATGGTLGQLVAYSRVPKHPLEQISAAASCLWHLETPLSLPKCRKMGSPEACHSLHVCTRVEKHWWWPPLGVCERYISASSKHTVRGWRSSIYRREFDPTWSQMSGWHRQMESPLHYLFHSEIWRVLMFCWERYFLLSWRAAPWFQRVWPEGMWWELEMPPALHTWTCIGFL